MDVVYQAATYYPYVFHPITLVCLGTVLLIYHEWGRQGADRSALYRRLGVFVGAGALSLVPSAAYILVTGKGPVAVTQGNGWQVDALVASGLFVVSGTLWAVWRRYDWGETVPGGMAALALVTVPYIGLSPVWNISGHVILSLWGPLYLTLVNRKFWPLLAIPVLMVPDRVIVNAHTWAQSVGAFLLASLLVIGLYYLQTDGSLRQEMGATAS